MANWHNVLRAISMASSECFYVIGPSMGNDYTLAPLPAFLLCNATMGDSDLLWQVKSPSLKPPLQMAQNHKKTSHCVKKTAQSYRRR